MSLTPSVATSASQDQGGAHNQWIKRATWLALVGCAALVVTKFLLIWRLNINWDEFNFLSHVHELARGELRLVINGSYTHLFGWLTTLPVDEAGQIIAARMLMFALFVATLVLIWKLASVWTQGASAYIAPLCYAAMSPVLMHGASFRYDSLLAPLSVAILVLLAHERPSRRRIVGAGLLLGAAGAISIKAILLTPVIVVLLAVARQPEHGKPIRSTVEALVLLALVSAGTTLLLIGLHKLSLPPGALGATEQTQAALDKTILDAPFFPRRAQYEATRDNDYFAWWLIYGGLICTLILARYRRASACALSLLPILFYRNAFPYYYVVMLAPACVLASVGVESMRKAIARTTRPVTVFALTAAVVVALSAQGLLHLYYLRHDDIERQRAVLDAAHSIFPAPVPYIDHSGAISSFQKANFFMSSWGLERYRARGESFILEAINEYRPPLLISNTPILDPEHPWSKLLLPIDRELIQRFYMPYWGPIRVAGAQIEIGPGVPASIQVPFAGAYRLEAGSKILVDGTSQQPGDIIHVRDAVQDIVVETSPGTSGNATIRLVWATAKPAPKELPPFRAFYTGL